MLSGLLGCRGYWVVESIGVVGLWDSRNIIVKRACEELILDIILTGNEIFIGGTFGLSY